jgi:arabinan endo-1,5-alpha-L-arabinosidase
MQKMGRSSLLSSVLRCTRYRVAAVVAAGVIANRVRLHWLWAAVAIAASFAVVAPAYAYPYPQVFTSASGGGVGCADPSMIYRLGEPAAGQNVWFLYCTSNQAWASTNRSKFYNTGPIEATQPWWTTGGYASTWAPDVRYNFANTYYLYYAESTSGTDNSAIGLATSKNGHPGTWLDHGSAIVSSQNGDSYNAIDPQLMVDYTTSRMWLTYGSSYCHQPPVPQDPATYYQCGIYTEEVDPATGLPTGGGAVEVAAAANSPSADPVEGADLEQWGSYYYLFLSKGGWCCGGTGNPNGTSNYEVVVGRSTSPTGPFLDENGVNLVNGGGTPILQSHDWVVGPGGEYVEYEKLDSKLMMLYAYWDSRLPYSDGRQVGMNQLNFDSNGWPYLS